MRSLIVVPLQDAFVEIVIKVNKFIPVFGIEVIGASYGLVPRIREIHGLDSSFDGLSRLTQLEVRWMVWNLSAPFVGGAPTGIAALS